MKTLKVSNPWGVKNQFVVKTEDEAMTEYFQSYDSIIVRRQLVGDTMKTTLDERYWDYSKTTGKYRNLYLGEDKKTTEKKIADGVYSVENLN